MEQGQEPQGLCLYEKAPSPFSVAENQKQQVGCELATFERLAGCLDMPGSPAASWQAAGVLSWEQPLKRGQLMIVPERGNGLDGGTAPFRPCL